MGNACMCVDKNDQAWLFLNPDQKPSKGCLALPFTIAVLLNGQISVDKELGRS